MQTLEVIARCLNTSVSYLLGETDNMAPDYFVISQKDNPVMYELICSLQNSDEASIKRLLAYYNALVNKGED